MSADMVSTPWTAEQAEALNEWQHRGDFHPYTCGNSSSHPVLLATPSGWICTACDYRQYWAHRFSFGATA